MTSSFNTKQDISWVLTTRAAGPPPNVEYVHAAIVWGTEFAESLMIPQRNGRGELVLVDLRRWQRGCST